MMPRNVLVLLLASVALTLTGTGARAQSVDGAAAPGWLERVGVSASLRAGMWSSTHDLDGDGPLGAGMIWAKLTRPVDKRVAVFVEGWTALQGPAGHDRARGELREG